MDNQLRGNVIPRKIFVISLLMAFVLLASPASTTAECRVVGGWNLEVLHLTKGRGFPELRGNKELKPRGGTEFKAIAKAIRDDMGTAIIGLSEINGFDKQDGSTGSKELEKLRANLGNDYQYSIAQAGKYQRLAFLWNSKLARMNHITEIKIQDIKVEDNFADKPLSNIFDRDPYVGHFTFIKDGQPQNDVTVVLVHLKSQQGRINNHNVAMRYLLIELARMRGRDEAYPKNEADILIVGDLNSSAFDTKDEMFFKFMPELGWKLLAEKPYPATRVNGSQIDYLFASEGLWGDEITVGQAKVHNEIGGGSPAQFRAIYSDHYPITTCINLGADKD